LTYRFTLFSKILLNSLFFEGFALRQLLRTTDTGLFSHLCLAIVKRRIDEICFTDTLLPNLALKEYYSYAFSAEGLLPFS
jgi:hypothetical protein